MFGVIGSAIGGIVGALTGANQQKKENEIADQNFNLQKEQFEYQKFLNDRQFNYQKELNDKMMEREDNAVQRRAADLEKAGMSKNLAAGSAATAGAMSSGGSQSAGNAPQRAVVDNTKILSTVGQSMGLAGQYFDNIQKEKTAEYTDAKTESEIANKDNIIQDTKNKELEAANIQADTTLKNVNATATEKRVANETKKTIAEINRMKVQNELDRQETLNKQHNYNVAKDTHMPIGATASSKLGGYIQDGIRILPQIGERIGDMTEVIPDVINRGKESLKKWKGIFGK